MTAPDAPAAREEQIAPREEQIAPREQQSAPREQQSAPREQQIASREQQNAARQQFKDAMSELASGVALLTVRREHPDADAGVTVTSLAAASLEPPMITVGIGRSTSVAPLLARGVEIGISILGADQRQLAVDFSRKGRPSANEILDGRPHHRGPQTGALLVDGALGTIEGRVEQIVSAGDHLLIVIHVLESRSGGSSEDALMYHRRGYLD